MGHSFVSKLKAHILQPLYLGWLTVNARSQDPPVGCRASVPWSGLVWLHPEHTNTAQDQPLSLSSIARVFAIPGAVASTHLKTCTVQTLER